MRQLDPSWWKNSRVGGKTRVLDGLARIVRGQGKLGDIDEVGLDARTLSQFLGDKPCRVLAHPAHSGRTKNHRDVQTPTRIHKHALL